MKDTAIKIKISLLIFFPTLIFFQVRCGIILKKRFIFRFLTHLNLFFCHFQLQVEGFQITILFFSSFSTHFQVADLFIHIKIFSLVSPHIFLLLGRQNFSVKKIQSECENLKPATEKVTQNMCKDEKL